MKLMAASIGTVAVLAATVTGFAPGSTPYSTPYALPFVEKPTNDDAGAFDGLLTLAQALRQGQQSAIERRRHRFGKWRDRWGVGMSPPDVDATHGINRRRNRRLPGCACNRARLAAADLFPNDEKRGTVFSALQAIQSTWPLGEY